MIYSNLAVHVYRMTFSYYQDKVAKILKRKRKLIHHFALYNCLVLNEINFENVRQ